MKPDSGPLSIRPSRSVFRPRHHCAASLIEILLTLSTCAVLLFFTFGAIGQMRESSNNARCIANLRQIGTAILTYTADNNGVYPPLFRGAAPAQSSDFWNYLIAPHLHLKEGEGAGVDALRCPSKSEDPDPSSTYGANYPTVLALESGQSGAFWLDIGRRRLANEIDKRAFLIGDASSPPIYSPEIWPLTVDTDHDGVLDSSPSFRYNRVEFRHRGRANFFLLNGAVISVTPAEWGENKDNLWGAAL